jgi:predicted Zn-dependent peptidase
LLIFSQDSAFAEAMHLGIYEMLGDYRLLDSYLPGIDKVTAADIRNAVKTI